MATTIDYFFYGASPFTYLGHHAISTVAAKHNVKLNYRPVNLFGLWEISGAVPPAQRPAVRQRYRLIELQRIAEYRKLPINLKPKHFPVDTTLADNCVIAISELGGNPSGYMASVFSGVWHEECNLADEDEITARLAANDFNPAAVIEKAKSDQIAKIRASNTKDAISQDAVGVPAYTLNGEVFWGQDRIELIDHALTTGRIPFKP